MQKLTVGHDTEDREPPGSIITGADQRAGSTVARGAEVFGALAETVCRVLWAGCGSTLAPVQPARMAPAASRPAMAP
jgi:hypothetical protein